MSKYTAKKRSHFKKPLTLEERQARENARKLRNKEHAARSRKRRKAELASLQQDNQYLRGEVERLRGLLATNHPEAVSPEVQAQYEAFKIECERRREENIRLITWNEKLKKEKAQLREENQGLQAKLAQKKESVSPEKYNALLAMNRGLSLEIRRLLSKKQSLDDQLQVMRGEVKRMALQRSETQPLRDQLQEAQAQLKAATGELAQKEAEIQLLRETVQVVAGREENPGKRQRVAARMSGDASPFPAAMPYCLDRGVMLPGEPVSPVSTELQGGSRTSVSDEGRYEAQDFAIGEDYGNNSTALLPWLGLSQSPVSWWGQSPGRIPGSVASGGAASPQASGDFASYDGLPPLNVATDDAELDGDDLWPFPMSPSF